MDWTRVVSFLVLGSNNYNNFDYFRNEMAV
jgi:hypothetical protein